MWRWLQKNHFNISAFLLTKRQTFLLQLGLLVLVGHLLFGFVFSLLYRGYHDHERFVISSKPQSATLVLCPLKKRIDQKKKKHKVEVDQKMSSTKVIDYQTYQKEKALPRAIEKQQQQAVKQPDKIEAKEQVKSVVKKDAIKAPLKMIDVEVIDTKPLKPEPKKECVKQEVKKEDVQERKQEQQDVKCRTDIDVENVEFVGYEQLDTLLIQSKIQQAVQQYFKPPVGLSKEISCEFNVAVSSKGSVTSAQIVRSSGIIAYDTSARTALYKSEFPKEVWNKTITVALGQ